MNLGFHDELGSMGHFYVAPGNSGFLSSCDGDLREPCVSSGKSGLLLSCEEHIRILSFHHRGIGPHRELRRETRCTSPAATGILGLISSFTRGLGLISFRVMDLHFPFEL